MTMIEWKTSILMTMKVELREVGGSINFSIGLIYRIGRKFVFCLSNENYD